MLARRGQVLSQGTVVQLVRKAACLSAAAAVGRTASHHGRHEALPRIADAQGAVGEAFQLHAQFLGQRAKHLQLFQGKLTRQGNALGAKGRRSTQTVFVVDVHLRGNVHFNIGNGTGQLDADADVLNDESIHAAAVRLTCQLQGILQFGGEHHRVQRKEHLHPAQMRVVATFGQAFQGEVVGTAACVEMASTQIHRIGPGTHCRMQASHVACRGQQLNARRRNGGFRALGLLDAGSGFEIPGHGFVLRSLATSGQKNGHLPMAAQFTGYP